MKLEGLYLVVNPKQESKELLSRLQLALNEGLAAVQLYNGWPKDFSQEQKIELLTSINKLCKSSNTPFLINNEWELLKDVPLDGVHFDILPSNWEALKKTIGRPIITGITLTNDLNRLQELEKLGIDYISFCAMFPSASVGTCELVDLKNVEKAIQKTALPIFVSGGITPENTLSFNNLPISGIAVISGIMNSNDPLKAIHAYKESLNKIKHHDSRIFE